LLVHVIYKALEKFERVLRVHRIENFFAASFIDHEVAGFEGLQMLGYRWLGKLYDARQLVHGLTTFDERFDDAVPGGIADAFAELVYLFAQIRHI
jgi:hypothetical protein